MTEPQDPAQTTRPSQTGLDDFRLTSAHDIGDMLKQLSENNVLLNINGSDGSVLTTKLWSIDSQRGRIGFTVDPDDPALHALIDCQEAAVVGYLNSVKLQFDAQDLVLVNGERTSVLSCEWPREMFRFQRRNAFRVRPLLRSSPTATVNPPELGDNPATLRVLDVSIGGCALFLPLDAPAVTAGRIWRQVQLELDADTRLGLDLRVQHVTPLNADAAGVRLGCEFVRADGTALSALQRFIDVTQKRGKLLALN